MLKTACFLVLHYELKPQLIVRIFDKAFIESIEQEKQGLTGKKYQQTMSRLSLLNQLVCAKYPHYKIPWFSEKWMMEQGLRTPRTK